MATTTTQVLFVTANVGSIFEDPTNMLNAWADEFLETVSRLDPKVVAIHCQEVGGKNYEHSMEHVQDFVQLLLSSKELRPFDKVRIFLDEDYSSAEHFTALGNFYFFHESIPAENVQIYNFEECKFVSVCDKEIHSGNIEAVPTKEKSKFPQEFFPECKWSRKGFMRTRWTLNGTVFDLVNIHLFHDASNFVAMESFPSVYCKNRQRALEHTLKRFHTDQYGIVPFFVFGDFNFRPDTQGVVKKLSEGLDAVRVQSAKSSDHTKLQYRDESSQVIFTLGKKEFSHQEHQKMFIGHDSDWLREYDRELDSFSGQLYEFSIDFPPTYPYVEDTDGGELYMQTRCPSWCDRVFLSAGARALVSNFGEDSSVKYGLIGQNACMGDHKPVFLQTALVSDLGTVSCCALPPASCTSCLCAASPVVHFCRLCSEKSLEPSSLSLYEEQEQDRNGLVVPSFHRHTSPYTPESTDTEPDFPEEITLGGKRSSIDSEDKINWRSSKIRSDPSCTSNMSNDFSEGHGLRRGSSSQRSASKIPVLREGSRVKHNVSSPPGSKIPILKPKAGENNSAEKQSNAKKIKTTPRSLSNANEDERLDDHTNMTDLKRASSHKKPSLCNTPSRSSLPKLRVNEGRNLLKRQNHIDEDNSPERKVVDVTDEDPVVNDVKHDAESKVETPTSEPETGLCPPSSATDSGVSMSPDLSNTTSPAIDSPRTIESENNTSECASEIQTPKFVPSERFSLVRRIQSASAMERKSSFPLSLSHVDESGASLPGLEEYESSPWGMRDCRCMSDSWRQRSSTVPHMTLSARMETRIRLKSSSTNFDNDSSLSRLQSHHSSSDEEWFEEVVDDAEEKEHVLNKDNDIKHFKSLDKIRRLSTHEEDVSGKSTLVDETFDLEQKECLSGKVEKLSLPEKSSDRSRHPSQSSADSSKAIVAVGKTLAQTCFLDTERDQKSKNLNETPLTNEEDVVEVEDSKIDLVLNLNEECSGMLKKERKRRDSKEQNKTRCTACCTLM